MGEEEPKKVDDQPETPVEEEFHPAQTHVVQERVPDEEVAPAPLESTATEKTSGGSIDREAVLARVETEKKCSLIKAWEDNEKAKVENKAHKKLSMIVSWENSKKASAEMQLKKIEEKLEKKKAEYAEKMKNKVAQIRKEAEEKRAMVEAKRGEESLKVEETAAKYRATGYTPRKFLGCFSR